MAAFVFKLAPVLQQRRAIERQKQLALGQIETQRVELESQIRGCQREIVRSRLDLRAQLGGGEGVTGSGGEQLADLRGARLQAASTLHWSAQAQRAVLKLSGVHTRLTQARAELAGAMKQRKAVELLYEKQYQEWLLDSKRKESAALDELAARIAATGGQSLESV